MRYYIADIVNIKSTDNIGEVVFSYRENGVTFYNVKNGRAYSRHKADELELIQRPATYEYAKEIENLIRYDDNTILKLYIGFALFQFERLSDAQLNALLNIYLNHDIKVFESLDAFIDSVIDYCYTLDLKSIQEYIDFKKEEEDNAR